MAPKSEGPAPRRIPIWCRLKYTTTLQITTPSSGEVNSDRPSRRAGLSSWRGRHCTSKWRAAVGTPLFSRPFLLPPAWNHFGARGDARLKGLCLWEPETGSCAAHLQTKPTFYFKSMLSGVLRGCIWSYCDQHLPQNTPQKSDG